jgi:hypothetical protein
MLPYRRLTPCRWREQRLMDSEVSSLGLGRNRSDLERDDFYLNRWDSRIGIEVIQP